MHPALGVEAESPGGNRITKTATAADGTGTTTHYVRDAQGNVLAVYQYKLNASGGLTEGDWLEQHLYGSSRLGMLHPNIVIPAGVPISNDYGYSSTPSQDPVGQSGSRQYELSNHLGNVLATITDKPLQLSGTMYSAELLSAQDYYPFGMGMPGRSYIAGSSLNGYRYGFNGKEKDDEVMGAGNEIDYGMRVYDPRAGRWLSPDPLFTVYPHQSPYVSMSNDPLNRIDPTGMGDYYDRDGKHLGSDGKTITVGKGKNAHQVSDDKAYIAESVVYGKNGLVTSAVNSKELSMSNSELGQFARMIYLESSNDLQESYAIASATVNSAQYRTASGTKTSVLQAAKKISSAWDNKIQTNNARFSMGAAINAITGGIDYSGGAIKWDGFDLAIKGFEHIKPRTEGIEISPTLFNAFKAAWPDRVLQKFSGNTDATFSANFSSGLHLATEGTYAGRSVFKAMAVHGRTIFWGVNSDPIINKTIWVTPFKIPGYSNPSSGLEGMPTQKTVQEHPNAGMKSYMWRGI